MENGAEITGTDNVRTATTELYVKRDVDET